MINIQRKPSVDEIDKPVAHNADHVDKELTQYTSNVPISIASERSVELRRIIDERVLLVMIVTYFLQTVDKGTLSFTSIMGLFIIRGIILACHASCRNFTGLVTAHTLLGILEYAFQPCFVILSAMWYCRDEQASRVTCPLLDA